jgi:mRNA interferase MazF
MVRRGEIRWADYGMPRGSEPGFRRPVAVVQADAFNASRLSTVLVAAVSSNTQLAQMPGNVFLPRTATGLDKDSVLNVTALTALDRTYLEEPAIGTLPAYLLHEVDAGIRRVLDV